MELLRAARHAASDQCPYRGLNVDSEQWIFYIVLTKNSSNQRKQNNLTKLERFWIVEVHLEPVPGRSRYQLSRSLLHSQVAMRTTNIRVERFLRILTAVYSVMDWRRLNNACTTFY